MPFSKFNSHPKQPFTLKIHRKKINNDKNLLFTIKRNINTRVCVV